MGSPDELDSLLALGSEQTPQAEACIDESAIDDGDLLAYRRGSLTDAAREQVEQHLIDCRFCRELVAHLEIPRRGRRWPALVAGAAASIAAAILFVVTPPPREPIGRYVIADARGAVATMRNEGQVEGRTYRPESQVAIKVEPSGGRPASIVRVFRQENGVLLEVPASIQAGTAGVFWIEATGRVMFGETAGAKRIVIVAADEGADLSRIAGRTLIAAQSLTTQASWLPTFDADYQTE